jgi:hypothetical protein
MWDLADHQFELLPDEDLPDGLEFGIYLDLSVDDGGFDPGSAEWIVQDGTNPLDGTTQFGRDSLAGETWAWNAHVNRTDETEALETLRRVRKAWRARATAKDPGKMSVIRYQMDGKRRRTYGRPRRLAAPPDNKILTGYVPVTMDFKTVTPLTFDDLEQMTTVNFNSTSNGGLRFPVAFPASPLPPGERQGSILVGGDAPTYPVYTFVGPIVNPWIMWDDRKWTFNASLNDGIRMTVDTRPWKRTIVANGSYAPGALGRRQYLQDMTIDPGGHEVVFGGLSSFGTAQLEFRWRDAYEGF